MHEFDIVARILEECRYISHSVEYLVEKFTDIPRKTVEEYVDKLRSNGLLVKLPYPHNTFLITQKGKRYLDKYYALLGVLGGRMVTEITGGE